MQNKGKRKHLVSEATWYFVTFIFRYFDFIPLHSLHLYLFELRKKRVRLFSSSFNPSICLCCTFVIFFFCFLFFIFFSIDTDFLSIYWPNFTFMPCLCKAKLGKSIINTTYALKRSQDEHAWRENDDDHHNSFSTDLNRFGLTEFWIQSNDNKNQTFLLQIFLLIIDQCLQYLQQCKDRSFFLINSVRTNPWFSYSNPWFSYQNFHEESKKKVVISSKRTISKFESQMMRDKLLHKLCHELSEALKIWKYLHMISSYILKQTHTQLSTKIKSAIDVASLIQSNSHFYFTIKCIV